MYSEIIYCLKHPPFETESVLMNKHENVSLCEQRSRKLKSCKIQTVSEFLLNHRNEAEALAEQHQREFTYNWTVSSYFRPEPVKTSLTWTHLRWAADSSGFKASDWETMKSKQNGCCCCFRRRCSSQEADQAANVCGRICSHVIMKNRKLFSFGEKTLYPSNFHVFISRSYSLRNYRHNNT